VFIFKLQRLIGPFKVVKLPFFLGLFDALLHKVFKSGYHVISLLAIPKKDIKLIWSLFKSPILLNPTLICKGYFLDTI
jgi:hypothetical protein